MIPGVLGQGPLWKGRHGHHGGALVKVAERLLLVERPAIVRELEAGGQHAFRQRGVETVVHGIRGDIRGTPRAAGAGDDGPLIVTVAADCSNAFNTLHRSAIRSQISRDPVMAPLRQLFNRLYGRPSELQLRDPASGKITILRSSSGVRQGDVLGGIFFCLALRPILERLSRDFPGVKFRAYMDDITVTGEVALVAEATKAMATGTAGSLQLGGIPSLQSKDLSPVREQLEPVTWWLLLGGGRPCCQRPLLQHPGAHASP